MSNTRVVEYFERAPRVKYYTVQYKRYVDSQHGLKTYVWETVTSDYTQMKAMWKRRRDAARAAKAFTESNNVDTQVVEHSE